MGLYLKECYDVKNGGLYWKWRPDHHFSDPSYALRFNNRFAGKRAGRLNKKNGYRYVVTLGGERLEHRVVFAIVHGRWPSDQIDHINRIRTDNRPENLREVSNLTNHQNMSFYANNATGKTGVHFCNTHKKYKAKITVFGKVISLGYYLKFEDAVAARVRAEKRYKIYEGKR